MNPSNEIRMRREMAAERLSTAILAEGLGMTPNRAPTPLRKATNSICRDLLSTGWDIDDLLNGVRFGIRTLWPFTESPNRPFTAAEFRQRVAEAVAAGRTHVSQHHRGQAALVIQRQRMEQRHKETLNVQG